MLKCCNVLIFNSFKYIEQKKIKEKDKLFMLENEAEIVEKARTDDQAFEILYNFYFPKIYGYMIKRVGNFEIAQDLVSITFLNVFTNLNKYTDKGYSFNAWVYRIATNNLIDYYRKADKRKEVNIDKIREIKDEGKTPEEEANNFLEGIFVRGILKDLPKKYQEILYLKFFAEKSNKEIAEILETNENNVRVLIFRGLKNFKEEYNKKI